MNKPSSKTEKAKWESMKATPKVLRRGRYVWISGGYGSPGSTYDVGANRAKREQRACART